MIVGCSHGSLASQRAIDAVLRFRDEFKPHFVAHLGDFLDTTAFRAHATNTPDEGANISEDIAAGLRFLIQLRPNVVLCGNHEDRLWRLRAHPKAIVAECAARIVSDIQQLCDRARIKLIPYAYEAHYQLGNYKLLHGVLFGENATRDHAEMFGNCVHAHTHRPAVAQGRRADHPTAYCVGTLANIPAMDYAKTRRSTYGWGYGFVWGYYSNTQCVLQLWDNQQSDEWPRSWRAITAV